MFNARGIGRHASRLRLWLLAALLSCTGTLFSASAQGPGRYMHPADSGAALAATTTTLTQIAVQPDGTLQFQVIVSSSSTGMPTGTVSLVVSGVSLGSAALQQGEAVLSVAPAAITPTAVLSAQYSGDSTFAASSSTGLEASGGTEGTGGSSSTGIVFSSASQASTPTVQPGGTASYAFTVGLAGGQLSTSPVSFSVSGLPMGATAQFSPSVLAAGSAPQTVTMTVQIAPPEVILSRRDGSAAVALACTAVPFIRRRRKGSRARGWTSVIARASDGVTAGRLLLLAIAAGCIALMTGCGVNEQTVVGPPQSYTMHVTAASGTLTQTVDAKLIVSAQSSS